MQIVGPSLVVVVLCGFGFLGDIVALAPQHQQSKAAVSGRASSALSRRGILALGLSSTFLLVADADAFPNKISNKYDDRPRQRGSMPRELGVATRQDLDGEDYLGLKHCKAAPNCFCSTDSLQDDPEHNIPAWIWPKEYDQQTAFTALSKVVNAYEPGQNNVDGGGFKVVTDDAKKGYIYVQFESLKNGYIDDVELAYIPGQERAVQVRSASRLGYLDYGVNAKRLNSIAKALREQGWDAVGVEEATHRNYFHHESSVS